jgi:lipoate-protein ligase A
MARDEALLVAVGEGASPPTLRFYAWSEPTVSLGYFQPLDAFRAEPAPIRDLPVVRRITGGGAILHDQEVTYSLVVPISAAWIRPNANRLYELAHQAVIDAVGAVARIAGRSGGAGPCDGPPGDAMPRVSHRGGPFFCFARRHEYDVLVPDKGAAGGMSKLAGSAQRRTRRAVLQHGSIILGSRFSQHSCAAWADLGGPREFGPAVERLAVAFRCAFSARLMDCAWSVKEITIASGLVPKYAGASWTLGCSANADGDSPRRPRIGAAIAGRS